MPCNPEYKCRINLSSLYQHNVLINGQKWRKSENTSSPMSDNEILDEIKQNYCDTNVLEQFYDYSSGWIYECEELSIKLDKG